MSPADKRNLEAWIGKRVRIEWVKPEDDWPYFELLKIDSAADVVFLQGADYPDGSAKHDGDSFWADWPDIKHIAPVKDTP